MDGDSGNVSPGAPARRLPFLVLAAWLLLGCVIAATVGVLVLQHRRRVAAETPPIYGELPAFALTAHDGRPVTRESMAGKVWVADFIFTRCLGQCPQMTARMLDLQRWLGAEGDKGVRLVSFSVDPEYDTPEVMTRYAKDKGADTSRWTFVTGTRKALYDLSNNGFHLGVDDKPTTASQEEPIVHSNRFILVDGAGRIRGYYVAFEPEDISRLHRDLAAVLREQQ